MLKTGVRALLYLSVTGREEELNGNRNHPNYLSTMEHAKVEIGAEILLPIGWEFGNSMGFRLRPQVVGSPGTELEFAL